MDISSITSLPEHIQIIFVSGYLGHVVANSGYRDKERKDELLYGILVFGLFGYMAYDLSRSLSEHILMPGLIALATSITVAIVWRKYLRDFLRKCIHKAAISNEDNIKGVWTGIIQNTRIAPTQIVIAMKNGAIFECDDVQQFNDAPIPLYYSDNDGNIALYVTSRTSPDGQKEEVQATRDPGWGDRITYIPAEEISNIDIRFMKK